MTEGEIATIIKRIEELDEKHTGRFTNIEGHLETLNGSVLILLEAKEDHDDKLEKVGLWQARWEGAWFAGKFAIPLILSAALGILGILVGRGL